MDVQYFFLFHWVIELTCSFDSSSTWRRVLNFFLVLWRILHSSSTCRGISELLIALVSGSCHPHHPGTQALTTSAYWGRLVVFVFLEALSTLRALVPSGCSPALRKGSHLPSAQSPLRLGLCLHHVHENEAQPAARSPEPSPLHPLLHDVWPVRFGLFVLYRGCKLDGLRRSSGSSRSLTARVACSVSSLLALHSILSFTLLKAWSRARRMDCPSHTLPPMSSSIA